MGLFSGKTFLGIDVGASAIKLVELGVKSGIPQLVNYGAISLTGIGKNGEIAYFQDQTQIQAHLLSLLSALKIRKHDAVYVAMPGRVGLVNVVSLPQMTEEELSQAVQFEANKYIPLPMDKIALSWDVIGDGTTGNDAKNGKKMSVLIVAAPKKDVAQFESLFSGTGLSMKALELENFALVRAMVGGDPGVFLLVDIGARTTNFSIVDNGVIHSSRTVDIGGGLITKALSEHMGVSQKDAEEYKKSHVFTEQDIKQMFYTIASALSTEITRITDAYTADSGKKIARGIVTGGCAKITALPAFLSRQKSFPFVLGDPWTRIATSQQIKPALQHHGASYAIAVGLALRGIEEQ